MPRTTWPIRRRDSSGLMLDQRRLLQELARCQNWTQACIRAEIHPERFRTWVKRDRAFRKVYDAIHQSAVELARVAMRAASYASVEALEKAHAAVKVPKRRIRCNHCRRWSTYENPEPDWRTRLRAAETVLKAVGLL